VLRFLRQLNKRDSYGTSSHDSRDACTDFVVARPPHLIHAACKRSSTAGNHNFKIWRQQAVSVEKANLMFEDEILETVMATAFLRCFHLYTVKLDGTSNDTM
jgi:hypothetical protein